MNIQSYLYNGNCLHALDSHGDCLVSAELYVPGGDDGAHLDEEAHDVIPGRVRVQSLLRLPVLNQVERVRANLPQKLIVDKPRAFLNKSMYFRVRRDAPRKLRNTLEIERFIILELQSEQKMFLTSYLRAKKKPRNQFKKLVHFVLFNLEDDLDMMLVWKSPGMKYILMFLAPTGSQGMLTSVCPGQVCLKHSSSV